MPQMFHDPIHWMALIGAGDRRALAQAITLVESTRPDHRDRADALLAALPSDPGRATRIGISGAPGVGKSTFIEALGLHLIAQGYKVAVLAVDPSSTRTGGSILGDKTRMEHLVRAPDAFIRPTPSGGTLGGVARRTREAIALVEAAGFDRVLVETVGVGQSEVAVADLVDLFMLLAGPAAGDELQGIKRGIMELADLIVVTKADGELAGPARHAAADLMAALHLARPKYPAWSTRVIITSAITGMGLDDVSGAFTAFRLALEASGDFIRLRAAQNLAALRSEIQYGLMDQFLNQPGRQAQLHDLERAVAEGRMTPRLAARAALHN